MKLIESLRKVPTSVINTFFHRITWSFVTLEILLFILLLLNFHNKYFILLCNLILTSIGLGVFVMILMIIITILIYPTIKK